MFITVFLLQIQVNCSFQCFWLLFLKEPLLNLVGKIIWCSTKNAVAAMLVKCGWRCSRWTCSAVRTAGFQRHTRWKCLLVHRPPAPHREVPRTIGEQKGLTANQSVLLLNDPKRRFGGILPLWDMSCLMWHGISHSCHQVCFLMDFKSGSMCLALMEKYEVWVYSEKERSGCSEDMALLCLRAFWNWSPSSCVSS